MKYLSNFAIEKTVKNESHNMKVLVAQEVSRANDTLGARVVIKTKQPKKFR